MSGGLAAGQVVSYEALAAFLERRRAAGAVLLVCIDGAGASGKSTIARGLAAASAGIDVVHLDDFYHARAARFAGPVAERPVAADFDLERLRREVLVPLRAGLPARYHHYDWSTDRVSTDAASITKPIVVVEGVYGSSRALSHFFDVCVWVECPREVRLARGLLRDGHAARSRWEEDWMPGEDRYIAAEHPRERATLVCDGARDDLASGVVLLRASTGRA